MQTVQNFKKETLMEVKKKIFLVAIEKWRKNFYLENLQMKEFELKKRKFKKLKILFFNEYIYNNNFKFTFYILKDSNNYIFKFNSKNFYVYDIDFYNTIKPLYNDLQFGIDNGFWEPIYKRTIDVLPLIMSENFIMHLDEIIIYHFDSGHEELRNFFITLNSIVSNNEINQSNNDQKDIKL